ncbi:techylectin-5A-like [Centruroides vittatus]|uniref:techylectin-5A-like n=1 Tax=Centruroides vittatus TaxID=120091 RepID=UPI0035109E51
MKVFCSLILILFVFSEQIFGFSFRSNKRDASEESTDNEHNDPPERAIDCQELMEKGVVESGIYEVCPKNKERELFCFEVYCDMNEEGGGWTFLERRGNFGYPSDYFYRNWQNYSQGFGDLDKEFWLGLDKMHSLTKEEIYFLRIDMKIFDGRVIKTAYRNFKIGSEEEKYPLSYCRYPYPEYPEGHLLSEARNQRFSTYDDHQENVWQSKCNDHKIGGWWYQSCLSTMAFHRKNMQNRCGWSMGWQWDRYAYSLLTFEMRIRRKIP